MSIKNIGIALNIFRTYTKGYLFLSNSIYVSGRKKVKIEMNKQGNRTDTLNLLLSSLNRETTYLEIGTRKPEHNFNKINALVKYSVDPGVEYKKNPVDFKMTSDMFFENLDGKKILSERIKFDVIYIDGLHLAEQVDRDIKNSLRYLKEDGFIVLHDCNPPTEWHARENYKYGYSPAGGVWNGTTWKAFVKWRANESVSTCCVDTDWGMGIISKKLNFGPILKTTESFYEFESLNKNRKEYLNLIEFKEFSKMINQKN